MKLMIRLGFLLVVCIPIFHPSSAALIEHLEITTLPNITFDSLLPLTKGKLELIYYLCYLSAIVYYKNESLAEGANYYSNPVDAFLTLDRDAYCIIAFKSSLEPELSIAPIVDWFGQNFDFKPHYVTKWRDPSIGCTVHRGFYEAFSSVSVPKMHTFIETCMAHSGKHLVFTGHSQGGAAASIASLVFADYDPLVVSSAQPPFLKKEPCQLANTRKLWRIINTENDRHHGLQYDPVAFSDNLKLITGKVLADHIGPSIHLPPNWDVETIPDPPVPAVLYRSRLNAKTYGPIWSLDVLSDGDGGALSAHRSLPYLQKLEFIILNSTTFPINVHGYVNGTQCQEHFECRSFVEKKQGGCIRNVCRDQLGRSGDPCWWRTDCQSKVCRRTSKGRKCK